MDERSYAALDSLLTPPSAVLANKQEVLEPKPYFDPQTVVSRDTRGEPVSRYGDQQWDFSSQSTDGKSGAKLSFFTVNNDENPELTALIREQHKALLWLHIDAGKMRALETVKHSRRATDVWCQKARRRGVDLYTLLSNPEWVAQDCESLNNAYLNITPALIQTLWRDRQTLKLAIDVPLQKLKAQIANVRSSRPDNFQTPLIPSRIYSLLLANLIHLLDAIERDLDVMLDAYRQSMEASRNAPIDGTAMQRKWFRGKALGSVVEKMKIFGYDPAKQALDRFIVGHINLTQSILMHVVAAFTGMRTGEVQILPVQGVLEAFEHRGSTHYLVKGYTHKLNNGVKRPASWITSREGHRAIQLAQRIARVIHEEVGGEAAPGQEALLFSSTESPYRSKTTECIGRYQKKLIEMASPEITQTDIDELNRLELERGWGRDGIEVGSRWPLAFHQLRRSLSVYAHRSGMVSLPSLKAQLQHITDEMRAYYSDGFCHAVNLVFDKDHFSHEWNAAKVESSYFGYTLALLFADEDLLGQGATQIAQVVSRRSREETLRLFQEGKLAYRETVLGGCVSTEECKTPPLDPIPFDCLKSNCINLVVASKRLDNVIRSQESIVAVLERDERGSVESRLEANNLKVLLKARQVLKENKA